MCNPKKTLTSSVPVSNRDQIENEIREIIADHRPHKQVCCPDIESFEYVDRNENVQRILGTYPVILPKIKSLLLEDLSKSTVFGNDISLYRDFLKSLDADLLQDNIVDTEEYARFIDLVHEENFVTKKIKRSPKFSNILACDLLKNNTFRERQLNLFNARAASEDPDLRLVIEASPKSIAYMSTDAAYSSCQNWKVNDVRGTEAHNNSHSVWANFQDPTVAVAYLYRGNQKVARSLIRVVDHENFHYMYFHRVYSFSYYGAILKNSLEALRFRYYVPVYLYNGKNYLIDETVWVPAVFDVDSMDSDGCDHCNSEGYVDEDCGDCRRRGEIDCEGCGATGRVECSTCQGEGELKIVCPLCEGEDDDCECCDGSGETSNVCEDCENGRVDCRSCGGDGKYDCQTCDGEGYLEIKCTHCEDGYVDGENRDSPILPYTDHSQIDFDDYGVTFEIPAIGEDFRVIYK